MLISICNKIAIVQYAKSAIIWYLPYVTRINHTFHYDEFRLEHVTYSHIVARTEDP